MASCHMVNKTVTKIGLKILAWSRFGVGALCIVVMLSKVAPVASLHMLWSVCVTSLSVPSIYGLYT